MSARVDTPCMSRVSERRLEARSTSDSKCASSFAQVLRDSRAFREVTEAAMRGAGEILHQVGAREPQQRRRRQGLRLERAHARLGAAGCRPVLERPADVDDDEQGEAA